MAEVIGWGDEWNWGAWYKINEVKSLENETT